MKIDPKKRLSALIIEDNPIDSKLLGQMLLKSSLGDLNVRSTNLLSSALNILDGEQFDVILLDLNLPDSSGLDTLLKIKGKSPHVAIVVITGAYDESLGLKAIASGAEEYLLKGKYGLHELSRSVRYAIERNYAQSELEKAYAELKDTQRRLIQSEKLSALGRFSSGIAHEVKNPLQIILGGTEFLLLQLDDADEETKVALKRIKEATLRADLILRGLLEYARPAELKTEKVRAFALINKTLSFLQYRKTFGKIKIETEPMDEEICVEVDENQLQQVLLNVLINAAEAMPTGGLITVRMNKGSLPGFSPSRLPCIIEVVDRGEGITTENLKRIFEPFFTTKRDRKGTGLGLFTSRTIVENHGGQILIESRSKEGTCVKIGLPII